MVFSDSEPSAQFARDVVQQLSAAGYQALWAGGCVRDHLLDRPPEDYDVATTATPDQVRAVFSRRRTIPIGASFGVITVLGTEASGQIEVATFRRDATYSDGRHPDSVTFSTAEEDAQRRDFTINGLFYDPLTDRVIDYVGGVEDLNRGLIRAIGDPVARLDEDKLRMLRAVRFAATFTFDLVPTTRQAIQEHSHQIRAVSAERITGELRRMLTADRRREAVSLLRECGLLHHVLPESTALEPGGPAGSQAWQETLQLLADLATPTFPVALAALLRQLVVAQDLREEGIREIFRRWKLSNDETDRTVWLLASEPLIRRASSASWPVLQRLLVADWIDELLQLAEPVALLADGNSDQIEFCRQKLALPAEKLNPKPLITGDDLIAHGIPTGPAYKRLLEAARDAQLDGAIHSKNEALELVDKQWKSGC